MAHLSRLQSRVVVGAERDWSGHSGEATVSVGKALMRDCESPCWTKLESSISSRTEGRSVGSFIRRGKQDLKAWKKGCSGEGALCC